MSKNKTDKTDKTDIVDLNDWLTIEEAVTASVQAGASRTGAQFYKLAKDGVLESRLIKTKRCLARQYVELYIAGIKQKNLTPRQTRSRRKSGQKEVVIQ